MPPKKPRKSTKKNITVMEEFRQSKLHENGVPWEQELFKDEPRTHERITTRRKHDGKFFEIYSRLHKAVLKGRVTRADAKKILEAMAFGKPAKEIIAEMFPKPKPKKKQPMLVSGEPVVFEGPAYKRRQARIQAIRTPEKPKAEAQFTRMEDLDPDRRKSIEKILKRIRQAGTRPLKPMFVSVALAQVIERLPNSKALTETVFKQAKDLVARNEKIGMLSAEDRQSIVQINNFSDRKTYIFNLQAEMLEKISSGEFDRVSGFARIIALEKHAKKFDELEKRMKRK